MSEIRRFKTLEKWIHELFTDSEKDGPPTGLAVVYKRPEGGTKEIDSVKLDGKTWEPKQLADRIQGKAEAYAQDLPGISSFALQAFWKGRREAEAEHPFVVIDGEVSSGGMHRKVRESPDSTGITNQLMRHLERREEMLIGLMQGFAATTLNREQKILDREEKMRDEVNDAYGIVRDLIMKAKQDDHRMELEILEKRQSMRQREQIMKTLPAVINTIADKEIVPQAVADTALIDMLAEQVTPDHIDQLEKIGLLKGEAAGILKLRLLKSQQEKKKEDEEAKKLPAASGDTLQ